MPAASPKQWLLALESSTANGGAALLCEGRPLHVARLAEGLRHGRELMPAAAGLLEREGLRVADLWAVAVSTGPGSYTGIRVGVMAAKALAYGSGRRLAGVSSLAALAAGLPLDGLAHPGDIVMTVQDARRDEVYAGLYRLEPDGSSVPLSTDTAVAPEEAAARLKDLRTAGQSPVLAGSGFATYREVFSQAGDVAAMPGLVNPAAVGVLAWRQLLREESADPLALQPEYLRRDAGNDWRHDHLITQAAANTGSEKMQ